MPGEVVVFGAGATGRAHVGLLAWQAGMEVVFVDKRADLVAALQHSSEYRVRVIGETRREITVGGFRCYFHLEREAIAREIADAALVLTAVFPENLLDVAETVAIAVRMCRERGRQVPINCICCENMMDSSSALRRHVEALLGDADRAYCGTMFGFPDCMISRVVPQPVDPLFLVTEDYNEWTVRAGDFLGSRPTGLTALELVDNQTARLERKLMIHNGGHAVCGYMGFHRGHRYVHEAVADPVVAEAVVGALAEIGEVVRLKHGFGAESIRAYQQDLCRRGQIAELRDEIVRVVRDPLRKLSRNERLVSPAVLAVEYGLPRAHIIHGIVAALKYRNPADPQSETIGRWLREMGEAAAVAAICSIPANSRLTAEILDAM